ncbi:StAR-related lipid transfer protein 5 [Trichuris trichiura]|uniref:StAR-related lipid transfer protein 5 n=1 Tax=Trichuris trichiura TaxID=36087 RepID=A0A077YVV8_TRITR|nr:StAR-related lipid transfer protein 5 [Trichuris trichiura]
MGIGEIDVDASVQLLKTEFENSVEDKSIWTVRRKSVSVHRKCFFRFTKVTAARLLIQNDTVVFSTQSPHFAGWKLKGETVVNFLPEKAYDMIHPTAKYRFQWDDHVESCTFLEDLAPGVILVHQHMKPLLMGFISARDSVDIIVQEEADQYYQLMLTGVKYSDIPPQPRYVRAVTYPSGMRIYRSSNSEKTRIICIIQADINVKHAPRYITNNAFVTMMFNYLTSLQGCKDLPWTPIENATGRTARK